MEDFIQEDIKHAKRKIITMAKKSPHFPIDTGRLKRSIRGRKLKSGFVFTIGNNLPENSAGAVYYAKYLQEGTQAHDIPGAFGYPLPFGIGGRFNGKFHPGSRKHVKWIEKTFIASTLDYYYKSSINGGNWEIEGNDLFKGFNWKDK